ncbi:MAG: site-2 protease family protein [Nanoarchaeota archaeon]
MNLDLLFAILFYGVIVLIFFKTRDKWEVQARIIALYKTKIGLKLMDKIANRFPRFMKYFGYTGIFFGFTGMLLIAFSLVKWTIELIFIEGAVPQIAPVLPGVKIPGLPVLGFWHWVIAIFIVATVHEFSHGVIARLYKLRVKSSGFGFIGPILLAFVEPDEKQVSKASKTAQLSMFSAGPYSNLILGALFSLLFLFIISPIQGNLFVVDKLTVDNFTAGLPAESSGLKLPFEIISLNGEKVVGSSINSLEKMFNEIKPENTVILNTDQGEFIIKAVKDEKSNRGLIGININLQTKIRQGYNESLGKVFNWFQLLIMWLGMVNIGVGLFNLLPLGPVDGGRMFYSLLLGITKDEKKSRKIWSFVSFILLLLIFINLLPWLAKLLPWISKFFSFLIGLIF